MTMRHIERFESVDTSLTYSFPLNAYEWAPGQPLRTAYSYGVGASFAYDHHGYASAPLGMSKETIRAFAVGTSLATLEAEIDDARATCWRIGLGKLWMLNSDASYRWAWGRLVSMPSFEIRPGVAASFHSPMVWEFERNSPWFDTTATTASAAVSVNYEAFTITNPGNIEVRTGFVLTLTATGAAGFSNVIITNVTNDQEIRWNGSARWASAVLRIDNSDLSITLLPDPGLVIGGSDSYVGEGGVGGPGVYADAYALASLGGRQSGFITLAPGDNDIVIQVDGTAAYTREHTFYGAWE